jgi:hypothetical protein
MAFECSYNSCHKRETMNGKNIITMCIVAALLVVTVATTIIYSSVSAAPQCIAKDTMITVNVYSGMVRNIPFKAGQTSNTVQGINVALKC